MNRPEQVVSKPLCDWLAIIAKRGASDLHVVPGYPPVVRIHGELREMKEAAINAESMRHMLLLACPPHVKERFQNEYNVDFSLDLSLDGQRLRFRANYFLSRHEMGACFRLIPSTVPDFAWARFPEELAKQIAHFRNGLVLICGTVGSGKTTSLAMLVNLLNSEGGYRIITVEEPVEYLFPRLPRSVVTQREVGTDVHTFADGLKYALRQDPDVILVGEIRDRETAQMAMSAAATGHLVFSTLHTRDAKGALSRYADLFPQADQSEVRAQLAFSLRAVVAQYLLPNMRPGEKRVLAMETLFNNSAVAGSLRAGRIEAIDNIILTGRSDGMYPLSESVRQLLAEGLISPQTAECFAGPMR